MERSFAKMYADAKKTKALRQLTPTFVEWKTEGKQIIGVFITRTQVTSSLNAQTYYHYLFETDDGRVKFGLGSQADGEVGQTLVEGQVYSIIYKGKQALKGGRSVNRFEVEEIGSSDEVPEEEIQAVTTGGVSSHGGKSKA